MTDMRILQRACEAVALQRRASAPAGNVVQSLSFSSIVPLTIWAFTFDWPLLDPAPALGSNFVLGTGENAAQLCMSGALVVSCVSASAEFVSVYHVKESSCWFACSVCVDS